MNAVKVNDLRKEFVLFKRTGWFSRERHEVVAVSGINFDVSQGESVALIGPNGAGKSTTIKMLSGILRPTSGTAEVLGLVPWKERTKLSYRIGAVFGQRSQLWYHLPPQETFDLLCKIYSLDPADYKRRKDMLIERFGLAEFLNIPVRKLSLGQRMRAEIAASLLHQPKLLFLDEPTIGLDVVARQELRDLIREWNREDGLTVLLTSHDAGDIESVAKRVIIVNHGRVVLDDRISAVKRRYMGEKILSVKFHELPESFELPGVTIIKSAGYALELEVDVTKTAIEQVISRVMKAGPVADINIEDPPLEEIIAHIYAQGQSSLASDAVA